MQDRRLHQPQLRLSQDLQDARRDRLLPAPIRMHHACNKVRRKLLQAHRQGHEDEDEGGEDDGGVDEGGLKPTKRMDLLPCTCLRTFSSQPIVLLVTATSTPRTFNVRRCKACVSTWIVYADLGCACVDVLIRRSRYALRASKLKSFSIH